ncbi:hypothetical protein [Nocardioides sp.]|uniref:hypothetical protein n=1 Tax=Nocardioides sp. TaxID=35761 RepID=UPI003784FC80
MQRPTPSVLGALLAATVLLLGLGVSPAAADSATLEDPTGDTDGPGLDITGATLRNLDHRVVVDVDVHRAVRGDLVVSVDPRHATGLRLVSLFRPTAHTRSFVLAGAFTDHATEGGDPRVPCRGFRVRWSTEAPTVRLTLPAHCLHDGEYDDLRFAVLTERSSDTDYAPDDAEASPWVPRG